jgi:hypothetical protein
MGLGENYEYLLLNQDLKPLRSDPRFRQLTEPARARFDEMLGLLRAAYRRGELPSYLDPALAELLPLVGVPWPW